VGDLLPAALILPETAFLQEVESRVEIVAGEGKDELLLFGYDLSLPW
jgi:hypothetical protein